MKFISVRDEGYMLSEETGRLLRSLTPVVLCVVFSTVGGCDATPNARLQPSAESVWWLSDQPVWSASHGEDIRRVAFAFDRPAGGVILEDGRIVVANRDHLVFLSREGTAYAVVGRSGGGPLEFGRIHAVYPSKDGVAAYDSFHRKLVLFGSDGAPRDEVRLPRALPLDPIGLSRARQIPAWMYSSTDLQPQVMVDSAGDVSEPYGSWIRAKRMAVPIVVSGRTFTIRHLPGCTALNLAALIGNSVYVAEQQSGTVFSVLPGRAQRSIFKLAGRTIDAEFARVWRTPPGGPPGSQRVADDILASFGKLGDPFPYSWDMLLADPTGSLWLRRVECGPPVRERLWDIVDTAGGLRGQLRTDAQLLAVNGGHALVVAGDSVTVSLRVIEGR